MKANDFLDILLGAGLDFFTGVPDSLLKELCFSITARLSCHQHIIAANEGNALALAAGHYLATGRPGVVYMQNSGLGNIVNPLLSLTDAAVYRIPALLIIGWRGEPGVHDEPQHTTQGRLTLPLLKTMGVAHTVLERANQVHEACECVMSSGEPYALVVRKGWFEAGEKLPARGEISSLPRESAIRETLEMLDERDIVVSTTGMISREVYENRRTHERDFLTVGSMGHASSIALGIALAQPQRRVVCLDGDGAMLMHLGALPVVAAQAVPNLRHIVLNNGAHDSVGGQPTAMGSVDLPTAARALGYEEAFCVDSVDGIRAVWQDFMQVPGTAMLEIRVQRGARKDLGRPKENPQQNKQAFMRYVQS